MIWAMKSLEIGVKVNAALQGYFILLKALVR